MNVLEKEARMYWLVMQSLRASRQTPDVEPAVLQPDIEELGVLYEYTTWPLLKHRCQKVVAAFVLATDTSDMADMA